MTRDHECRRIGSAARSLARLVAGAMVALALATVSQPGLADTPPAVIETPLRDPWVPPEARQPSTSPPTQGAELRAQVERKLAASFDAADVNRTGSLTREQAKAAGLGFVARHFDEIDSRRSGSIRFDDVMRYLDQRRANSQRR